jgi:hypothetical protein
MGQNQLTVRYLQFDDRNACANLLIEAFAAKFHYRASLPFLQFRKHDPLKSPTPCIAMQCLIANLNYLQSSLKYTEEKYDN